MGSKRGRARLDVLLVERGLSPTRSQAQALILAGRVRSGERRLDKPGLQLADDTPIEVTPGRRWVGRGGYKLAGALETFGIRADGRDAIDVGASTGGFTQALLEAGFGRVIALDVGRGQLDWGLRNDPRVHPLEGVNARYLMREQLPFSPGFASVDVSFISLRLVLPAVEACLSGSREIVALIKPQFEVGRGEVGRGGIVRDARAHERVLHEISGFAAERGWAVRGLCPSPIRGTDGNREFLIHLIPDAEPEEATVVAEWATRALEPDEERP